MSIHSPKPRTFIGEDFLALIESENRRAFTAAYPNFRLSGRDGSSKENAVVISGVSDQISIYEIEKILARALEFVTNATLLTVEDDTGHFEVVLSDEGEIWFNSGSCLIDTPGE